MTIHSTAILGQNVKLGDKVIIGPYCVIGDNVQIGDYCELISHVVIEGNTILGTNNKIFPFASLGIEPQVKKGIFKEAKLTIGNNNVIREYVTISPGTTEGDGETIVGNNCLLMVSSHIGHDSIVHDNVVMANNVAIGGHVIIERDVIIGGNAAIHQFVTIGTGTMVGGGSLVSKNILPYSLITMDKAYVDSVNITGLKRNRVALDDIKAVRDAFDILIFNTDEHEQFDQRIIRIESKYHNNDFIKRILDFAKSKNIARRGIHTKRKES